MDCNAATRNVPPCLCGGGCREYLLPLVGMPGTRRADALHEACWCLALYKSRRWNEAKEASEQRVEGTLIKWRLKIEDWKFLRPVLKTRWRSNKRQSRAGSKRHSRAENWKPREKTWLKSVFEKYFTFLVKIIAKIFGGVKYFYYLCCVKSEEWRVKSEESSTKAPKDYSLTSHY